MLLTKFLFIWLLGFRREDFLEINQSETRIALSTDRDEMSSSDRKPAIGASYQVSVHLARRFKRKRLKCEKLRTTDDGRMQIMAKAHIAFGKVR